MHDPAAVRLVEPIRDLRAKLQDLVEGQRTLFKSLGEGIAFDALHHQIIRAVLVADVEEHANVGVIEARDGLGFAFEPLLP